MPQEVLRPEIVERLEESLERLEEARESLLRDGRDAMLAIRRAIARVHSGDEEGARAMLEEAGRILRGMKERADADLERYVLPVEAEYVEASAFRDLAFGAALRGADELGVDPRAYVLGLLDAVGECRRLVYDSVREGDLERAGRLFEAMDDIYSKLMHMVVYDRTAGGLKRKLDAAKISLDDAARILTEARLSRRGDQRAARGPSTAASEPQLGPYIAGLYVGVWAVQPEDLELEAPRGPRPHQGLLLMYLIVAQGDDVGPHALHRVHDIDRAAEQRHVDHPEGRYQLQPEVLGVQRGTALVPPDGEVAGHHHHQQVAQGPGPLERVYVARVYDVEDPAGEDHPHRRPASVREHVARGLGAHQPAVAHGREPPLHQLPREAHRLGELARPDGPALEPRLEYVPQYSQLVRGHAPAHLGQSWSPGPS